MNGITARIFLVATFCVGLTSALAAPTRPAPSMQAITPFPHIVPNGDRNVTTQIVLRPAHAEFSTFVRPPLIVNVEPGTHVTLALTPLASGPVSGIFWSKDGGGPVLATTPVLDLGAVRAEDSGSYSASVNSPVGTLFEVMDLRVEAVMRQRMLNLSTRATLGPSQRSFISGFVISSSLGNLGEVKRVLIRAVGPTLAKYGITDALADPKLTIYRSDGSVETGGSNMTQAELDAMYRSVGAFPIAEGTKDVIRVVNLSTAVYSAEVSSASGASGSVVLEIYELPLLSE